MHATRYIHYIYIIGIAFLLQGCRRESHPSTPDTESYAISMSPSTVRGGARAIIENVGDLQGLGSFGVYGYKVASWGKQQVFGAQEVTYDDGDGVWEYAPIKKYWDRSAAYYFGAYAPHGLAIEEATDEDGIVTGFTIKNLPQWQKVDDSVIDVIVATSKGQATDYINTNGGTVNLAFNHIYARLVVKLVKNAKLVSTYTLNSLTYGRNVGADVRLLPAETNTTYSLNYTSGTGTMPLSGEKSLFPACTTASEVTTEEVVFADHLLIPNTVDGAGLPIVVDYKIESSNFTSLVETAQKEFEAGKVYTYTLKFESGYLLTLESVSVQDWDDVEDVNDDPVYNW